MTFGIKVVVEKMYDAANVTFPAQAEVVSAASTSVTEAASVWEGQSFRAGDPAPIVDAVALDHEVFGYLRRATLTLNDAVLTLTAVADDFVATDERAAEAARRLRGRIEAPGGPADVPHEAR